MRKILCIVIAVAILSFSIYSYVQAEDTEIVDLQTQREELQNQIDDSRSPLIESTPIVSFKPKSRILRLFRKNARK